MGRATPKPVLDRLAGLPLFSACSRKELEAVARIGAPIVVEPGYLLTRQGRRGFEFFIVLSGEASCQIDGEEVARFGPGDFFGEMSILDRKPRSATVEAASAMEVIAIDSREFTAMLDTAPSTTRKILATLSERLRAAHVSGVAHTVPEPLPS